MTASHNRRTKRAGTLRLLKEVIKRPRIIKAGLRLNLFLLGYMKKFRARDVGGHLILHSHLPPLNSRAYGRFIDEHLIGKTDGPSHAQIGLTNACPQSCGYCYNKGRTGKAMDKATILQTIADLKRLGVFWLGLTGGEPLLNKDIVEITEKAADGCAVKLFTTGCTLTPGLAADLKSAGLFSVCVSLDHWREDVHDRVRNYPGAFRTALAAIDIFKNAGLDTGVSSVLSKDMISTGRVEEFLSFLESLDVDEAWLSETKPSVQDFWTDDLVITEDERRGLSRRQDRRNKSRNPSGSMTMNYLGHFEGGEHFGCNAGSKMIYIDAFGDVSPCVFTPMAFGNVRESALSDIWGDMRRRFSPGSSCFVNKNFKLLQKYSQGRLPISRENALALLREIDFGLPGRFVRLYQGRGAKISRRIP